MNDPQTMTITADLQDAMKRDVSRRALGLTRVLVLWALLAVVLTALIAKRFMQPVFSGLDLIMVALALLFAALILSTVRTARKSLETALPIGSVVTVRTTDEKLEMTSVLGESELRWASLGRVSILSTVALLSIKGTSMLTAVPITLLDESALTRLRT